MCLTSISLPSSLLKAKASKKASKPSADRVGCTVATPLRVQSIRVWGPRTPRWSHSLRRARPRIFPSPHCQRSQPRARGARRFHRLCSFASTPSRYPPLTCASVPRHHCRPILPHAHSLSPPQLSPHGADPRGPRSPTLHPHQPNQHILHVLVRAPDLKWRRDATSLPRRARQSSPVPK